jgi:hypothetical protein
MRLQFYPGRNVNFTIHEMYRTIDPCQFADLRPINLERLSHHVHRVADRHEDRLVIGWTMPSAPERRLTYATAADMHRGPRRLEFVGERCIGSKATHVLHHSELVKKLSSVLSYHGFLVHHGSLEYSSHAKSLG